MDNFFSQRQKEAEWKVITSQRIPIRPIIASSFPVKCNLYRIYPNQTNFLQIFLINFLSNSPKYRELLTGGTVFPQFLTAPKIVFWDSQEQGGYFSTPKQFLNNFFKIPTSTNPSLEYKISNTNCYFWDANELLKLFIYQICHRN